MLFAAIVKQNKDRAWKSRRHCDSQALRDHPDWFIVGIETPEGQFSYHYRVDKYWDLFDCEELGQSPEWDGHTSPDVIRLLSL